MNERIANVIFHKKQAEGLEKNDVFATKIIENIIILLKQGR